MKRNWLLVVLLVVAGFLVLLLNRSWRQKISGAGDVIGSLWPLGNKVAHPTVAAGRVPTVATPPEAAATPAAPEVASSGSKGSAPAGSENQGYEPLSSSRSAAGRSAASEPSPASAPTPADDSQRPEVSVPSAAPPTPPQPLPGGKTIVTRLTSPLNIDTLRDGDPITVSAVLPPDFTGDHLKGHVLIQGTTGAEGLLLDFNVLDHQGSSIAVETRVLKIQNTTHDLTVTEQGLIAGTPNHLLKVPAGAYLVVSVRRR